MAKDDSSNRVVATYLTFLCCFGHVNLEMPVESQVELAHGLPREFRGMSTPLIMVTGGW